MKNDEFEKLFKYIEKRFDKLDERLDIVDEKVDKVYDHLDSIEKTLDIDESERLVMGHQADRLADKVDRHEVRITKLEKRTV
ncbi:MAG: hypothetical protein LBG75_01445 [Candidatus Nomurabacteria bacterium]|jgi:hypothetical protein|nr:hypothetical protein [Candidatus Nomurabacteria bacterium]